MKKDIKNLVSQVEDKLIKRMHEKPSEKTLNHLALFLGFQSWESFRRHMHDDVEGNAGADTTPATNSTTTQQQLNNDVNASK